MNYKNMTNEEIKEQLEWSDTQEFSYEYSMWAFNEIERLNKILNDIDTYIHLWKIDDIGEKTMLILNDILLIKNGMSDKVVRLKDSDKE